MSLMPKGGLEPPRIAPLDPKSRNMPASFAQRRESYGALNGRNWPPAHQSLPQIFLHSVASPHHSSSRAEGFRRAPSGRRYRPRQASLPAPIPFPWRRPQKFGPRVQGWRLHERGRSTARKDPPREERPIQRRERLGTRCSRTFGAITDPMEGSRSARPTPGAA